MNEDKPNPTKIKEGIQEVFDAIASQYSDTRTSPWPMTIDFLNTIDEGSLVADLGCGPAQNSVPLVRRGISVIGIDLSRGQLEMARTRMVSEAGGDCDLIQADIVSLPLKEGTADAALMIAALHHLPSEKERFEALLEVHRCLRPGGRALISAWAFDQPRFKSILEEHENGRFEHGGFGDVLVPWKKPNEGGGEYLRFYHLFLGGELEMIVDRTPLEIEHVSCDGPNHFVSVSKKVAREGSVRTY